MACNNLVLKKKLLSFKLSLSLFGKCLFFFLRNPVQLCLVCLLFWVTIWIQRPAAIYVALVRVKPVLYSSSRNRKEAHFRDGHLYYHHVITSYSFKCKCKDWFYLPLYISSHCKWDWNRAFNILARAIWIHYTLDYNKYYSRAVVEINYLTVSF